MACTIDENRYCGKHTKQHKDDTYSPYMAKDVKELAKDCGIPLRTKSRKGSRSHQKSTSVLCRQLRSCSRGGPCQGDGSGYGTGRSGSWKDSDVWKGPKHAKHWDSAFLAPTGTPIGANVHFPSLLDYGSGTPSYQVGNAISGFNFNSAAAKSAAALALPVAEGVTPSYGFVNNGTPWVNRFGDKSAANFADTASAFKQQYANRF
jgi:hypothetical protein